MTARQKTILVVVSRPVAARVVHCGDVAVKWWRALVTWWRYGIYPCTEMSADGRVRCPGVIGWTDGVCDVCGAAS